MGAADLCFGREGCQALQACVHFCSGTIEHSPTPGAKHGVATEEDPIDDVRDMSIEVSLGQPNIPFRIANLKTRALANLLSDAWYFVASLFRTDHPHRSKEVPLFQIAVDADVIGMGMRIDDRGEPDVLFLAIIEY